ncbi:MAG: class I SAM-dependent rRNA methyltransferase [Paludibacteraceae bacterium]|nr:class I SAM-dependent rRNA methyltransferase [Prevotella sp.]MBQ8705876.1 class I SAM-dependent rRNA methyltransferase [Paludibacteraceae bacterium]MBQ8714461.1 class I SAM-dependent rRNA methyltransferase [Prevotella sp.]
MKYKKIQLRKGKDESLRRFHPWVFSGAIQHMEEGIQEGELVRVVTFEGDFIAVGHYQQGSIAVRVLTFSDVEIDREFWYSRLRSALQMRLDIGIADNPRNNTYRLVHGEGDHLPGLIIDVYGKTAVMQAHSIGMHLMRKEIAKVLVEVMDARIAHIYYKSETTLPFMTEEDMNGFLYGGSDDNIALENGLKFRVDWLRGQKTGFFVDQRENRSLLEQYAKGKRVLNMFCYTGGFSFYAMRGGAELVHSVDSSGKAIALTKENVSLNFPGDARHEAYCEDAFKFLEGIGKPTTDSQQPSVSYNLIILDPPAFAKHRGALHNALKGYTRLNQKAFEKIEKGGILFTFSCSQVVTKDHFRNAVFTAAALAKRKVRILHQLHQPADHPVNIYHPEGEYLKGLVLYVE